jgi:hypothetical protein
LPTVEPDARCVSSSQDGRHHPEADGQHRSRPEYDALSPVVWCGPPVGEIVADPERYDGDRDQDQLQFRHPGGECSGCHAQD